MGTTDLEKIRIKALTDESDYGLWKIRIEEALSGLGLEEVLERDISEGDSTSAATSSDAAGASPSPRNSERNKMRRKASAIITSALSDNALRVVRSVCGNPYKMMTKLDERYDSKTMASKISRMSDLLSLQYTSPSKDISKHVDRLAGLLDQVRAMKTSIDDTFAIGILVASIKAPALGPTIAAIKTVSGNELTWDGVAQRLIEEWRDLDRTTQQEEKIYVARVRCGHCGRKGHKEKDCWQKKKSRSAVSSESENDDENQSCHEPTRERLRGRLA